MLFQFHEGPIKTQAKHEKTVPLSCFNSMKVRLKPANGNVPSTNIFSFNSMKVRLKQCRLKEHENLVAVSIP